MRIFSIITIMSGQVGLPARTEESRESLLAKLKCALLEHNVDCYNSDELDMELLEFYCAGCHRIFKGLSQLPGHVESNKHIQQNKVFQTWKDSLTKARNLSFSEIENLNKFLQSVYSRNIMSDDEIKKRQKICTLVKNTLREYGIPGIIDCVLFGSSFTGIGEKDVDLNMNLRIDLKEVPVIESDQHRLLLAAHNIISSSEHFIDAEETNTSMINSTHKESGLLCYLEINTNEPWHTAQLIQSFVKIDHRVKMLMFLFKHWAKVCGIASQESGSLPSYCFILMVVHYLQQTSPPILPVFDGIPDDCHKRPVNVAREKASTIPYGEWKRWKTKNTDSIALLWIGLLRYYLLDFHIEYHIVNVRQVTPLHRSCKKWNSKLIAIEDPYIKKNVAINVISKQVYTFIVECLENSYRYFSRSAKIDTKDEEVKTVEKPVETPKNGLIKKETPTTVTPPEPIPDPVQIEERKLSEEEEVRQDLLKILKISGSDGVACQEKNENENEKDSLQDKISRMNDDLSEYVPWIRIVSVLEHFGKPRVHSLLYDEEYGIYKDNIKEILLNQNEYLKENEIEYLTDRLERNNFDLTDEDQLIVLCNLMIKLTRWPIRNTGEPFKFKKLPMENANEMDCVFFLR
jgi:DNA polymerase sigma